MNLHELSGEQRRQIIDTQQVYTAWREADNAKRRRFAGGMRWVRRSGADYLLRKVGTVEKSLGRRSETTESTYAAFMTGRQANREKLKNLTKRLDEMAPVNRAMSLGRLPTVAARIARKCDEKGLLGQQLIVVGTNALYAYEAMAGLRIDSGLIATGDIDLLLDARRRLSFAIAEDFRDRGFLGLLQQINHSFSLAHNRTYRASNEDGYTVDLIRPQGRDIMRASLPTGLTDLSEDMEGATIFGLDWLINTTKAEAVVLDERGYPVRLAVIDPRVFALHKAWLSKRQDREPLKASRDHQQALVAAIIASRYLRLSFDGPNLSALPAILRALAPEILAEAEQMVGAGSDTPDW